RDLRGSAFYGLQPSSLVAFQCVYLVEERKLAEAEPMCRRALELGSQIWAYDGLARLALLSGDLEAARTNSALATRIGGSWQWTLRAVVLSVLSADVHEIRDALNHAFQDPGRPLAARLVQHRVQKSPQGWVKELEAEEREGWGRALAHCGHVYLELG